MHIDTLKGERGWHLCTPKIARRGLAADHVTHLQRYGRTVAMRHSMGENGTILYTLDFSNRTCEQFDTIAAASDRVVDYLNQGAHRFSPDTPLTVYVNQGSRDALVLANIGDKVLIEYEMPAGTTALLIFDARYNDLRGRRNMAYSICPQKWIDAMHEAGTEWFGRGQRMTVDMPMPKDEVLADRLSWHDKEGTLI